MLRNMVCVWLCGALVWPSAIGQEPIATIQEKVGLIATGSIVEVKTKIKTMKRVTGRLGEVSGEGFEIQITKGTRVEQVKLQFSDVTAVKEIGQGKGSDTAIKVLAGVGIALGGLIVFGLILAAASN